MLGGGGSKGRVVVLESSALDFAIRCIIHSISERESCEGVGSTSIWLSLGSIPSIPFAEIWGCGCGSFTQEGPFPVRGCITF